MSNRTLLEINHDYAHTISEAGFRSALETYLRSGSRAFEEDLARFGIRIIARRHHSEHYTIPMPTEGFPPDYSEKSK